MQKKDTAQTAQSAPKQQKYKIYLSFIVVGLYNFVL